MACIIEAVNSALCGIDPMHTTISKPLVTDNENLSLANIASQLQHPHQEVEAVSIALL